MNEEALNDSFNLFASQGYNGSIEDYKELMVSNKDARADSYNLFTGEGYNGTDTDFNDLIGVSGQVTQKNSHHWRRRLHFPQTNPP